LVAATPKDAPECVEHVRRSSGLSPIGLALSSNTRRYGFKALSEVISGWTLYGVYAPSPLRADIELTDVKILGHTVRSGIDIRSFIERGIKISGGSTTLTNQNYSGHGGIIVQAQADGVAADVARHDITVTYDATYIGVGASAVRLVNMRATIDGGTYRLTGHSAHGAKGYLAQISTNRAGDETELPISGSVMRNLRNCRNTAAGGTIFHMGDDGGDRRKAVGCLVEDCDGSGDDRFVAGYGHFLFLCNLKGGLARRVKGKRASIGLIIKLSDDTAIEDSEAEDMTSSYMLAKGSRRFAFCRNTLKATTPGFSGPMLVVHSDPDPGGGPSTDGVVEDCKFVANGALGVVFVNIDVGQTVSLARNDYRHLHGTLNAYPWRVGGKLYTRFEDYQRDVEPTATSNIP
jgi:hypothetical protein